MALLNLKKKLPKLTKNFSESEFSCPCCGNSEIDSEFVFKLQELRTSCNFSFKVNSGWRCEEYNTKISKKSMGDHTRGLAVDIHLNDRYKRATFLQYALSMGYFKDIAISKTFIHLGRGKSKQGVGVYG